MKKIFGKVNEKGTLLVEAMAMLGLIAMVTPVLYKKAAERTVELQDVNASSQLRALSSAVDSYIKDNFAKITKGDTINGIDYSSFKDADNGAVGPISLSHFADYLPYGFLNNDGSTRETKLFTDNYNVWIKLEADYQNYTDPTTGNTERKALSQILTGFVSAKPKNAEEIGQVRASRIASMIGSNGGYVIDSATVMGAQGIWSVPVNEFNNNDFANNTFVVSSLQPISSQGLANEDVLHRKDEPDADQELNTMETDLFMGFTEDTTRNIRMVNQIIMNPDPDRMVGSGNESAHNAPDNMQPLTGNDATDLDKALYITKGGGAYLEGALNAMNSLFSVNSQGIRYFGSTETEEVQPDGSTKKLTSRAAEPLMKIDGTSMVYGNPGAGNAKLTVNSAGNMSYGSDEVKADDGTVTEGANVSLYADKTNFKAGDGALRVSKEENAAGGNTAWVSVFNQGDAHEGGRTTYTWNGAVPTEDAAETTGKYEVSINGSAFVKDTLLTGKIKSFNIDVATLRAGVDPTDFDEAQFDTDFYTVTRRGSFVAGKSDTPVMTISEEDYTDDEGRDIKAGVVIHTTADASLRGVAEGIDIRAGDTALPAVNAEYIPRGIDENTQENIVRIGGQDGVFLTAYDDAGKVTGAPVSIQGDMLRAYKNANYNTIDTYTHQFNLMSYWLYNSTANGGTYLDVAYDHFREPYRNTSYGRVYIADSNVLVAAYTGEVVADIMPTKSSTNPTAKFSGGFAVYDYDYYFNKPDANGNDRNKANMDDASFIVRKGAVEVRTTANNDSNKNLTHGDKILVVDNNKSTSASTGVPDNDAGKGSVYIRKGSMNLATYGDNKVRLTNQNILDQYKDGNSDSAKDKEKAAVGYIAADRFISHYNVAKDSADALTATAKFGGYTEENKVVGSGKTYQAYAGYEVNPAYTSVMHDIKLTTRGGARLSDILPDFINKGIYVIDTTYKDDTVWYKTTHTEIENDNKDLGDDASAEEMVSPYAGFIPTPKCPPGYAKVVTLTPSGWAMAQAGTPVMRNGYVDIMSHTNPSEFLAITPESGDTVQPLTYQKNTWLKAMVLPECDRGDGRKMILDTKDSNCGGKTDFQGWGAILGFIYPATYYDQFINHNKTPNTQKPGTGQTSSNDVYWNLFPAYYKQIEGYATVYCYFDRSDPTWKNDLVDYKYDQIKARDDGNLNYYQRDNTEYEKRLNDPNLKYYDPW